MTVTAALSCWRVTWPRRNCLREVGPEKDWIRFVSQANLLADNHDRRSDWRNNESDIIKGSCQMSRGPPKGVSASTYWHDKSCGRQPHQPARNIQSCVWNIYQHVTTRCVNPGNPWEFLGWKRKTRSEPQTMPKWDHQDFHENWLKLISKLFSSVSMQLHCRLMCTVSGQANMWPELPVGRWEEADCITVAHLGIVLSVVGLSGCSINEPLSVEPTDWFLFSFLFFKSILWLNIICIWIHI